MKHLIKCWEIIECDNRDCPARNEPETPCWEIAEKIVSYQDISNTCRDCLVYILNRETTVLSRDEIESVIKQRKFSRKLEKAMLNCILQVKGKKNNPA